MKRLKEIVNLSKQYERIADVGCDHGKVLGECFKAGAKYLIASDISAPSVNKAKVLLNSLNCKQFDVRVGDGFKTLNDSDNIDCIIVAGMGGLEIIKILNENKIKLKTLVLQPQNNVYRLREYLVQNNFNIETDYVVKDKKMFYNILKVSKSNTNHSLTSLELEFGKTNLKQFSEDFVDWLNFEIDQLNKRLNNVNPELKHQYQLTIEKYKQQIAEAIKRK